MLHELGVVGTVHAELYYETISYNPTILFFQQASHTNPFVDFFVLISLLIKRQLILATALWSRQRQVKENNASVGCSTHSSLFRSLLADQDEDCLEPDIEHLSEAKIRERRRDWEERERRQGEYERRVCKVFEDNKRQAWIETTEAETIAQERADNVPPSDRHYIFEDTHVSSSRFEKVDVGTLAKEDQRCPICRADLENPETVRLPCNPVYHRECISMWLKNNATCPYCMNSYQRLRMERLYHGWWATGRMPTQF